PNLRTQLHKIQTHHVAPVRKLARKVHEILPTQPTRFGRAGRWHQRRIHSIDVDREIDMLSKLVNDFDEPLGVFLDVLHIEDLASQLGKSLHLFVGYVPDSDMHDWTHFHDSA